RENEARRQAAGGAARPVDLAARALLGDAPLRLPPAEHVLLVNLHHVIADGWSVGIFYGELDALYAAALEGRPSPLAALPVQYADYAAWQRQCLAGGGLAAHLAFWRQRLGDGLPLLRLPADRPRPAVQSFRGGMLRLEVPSDLALSLRTLGQ